MKIVSVEGRRLQLKETPFLVIFQQTRSSESIYDLLVHFILTILTIFISHGSTQLAVSLKTKIYLDFSIKNAGFVFAVEICNISAFVYYFELQFLLIYCCRVKFCTEKLKSARRKLLKLRNKHSAFVPNVAYFYPRTQGGGGGGYSLISTI